MKLISDRYRTVTQGGRRRDRDGAPEAGGRHRAGWGKPVLSAPAGPETGPEHLGAGLECQVRRAPGRGRNTLERAWNVRSGGPRDGEAGG